MDESQLYWRLLFFREGNFGMPAVTSGKTLSILLTRDCVFHILCVRDGAVFVLYLKHICWWSPLRLNLFVSLCRCISDLLLLYCATSNLYFTLLYISSISTFFQRLTYENVTFFSYLVERTVGLFIDSISSASGFVVLLNLRLFCVALKQFYERMQSHWIILYL